MSDELNNELDKMPGPHQLREHAKTLRSELTAAKGREKDLLKELASYKRRDAFEAALAEASDLTDPVSLDDIGDDVPAEEITPQLLTVKAAERAQQRYELLSATAKEMGFDSVTEFEEATLRAQEEKEVERASLQAQAVIAFGGQALPAPAPSPSERATEAFQRAKDLGAPDDAAQAAYVHAQLEAQSTPTRRPRR